jgi:hypothetical protein
MTEFKKVQIMEPRMIYRAKRIKTQSTSGHEWPRPEWPVDYDNPEIEVKILNVCK